MRRACAIPAVLLLGLHAGCAWTGKDGHHSLVLGFGVITTQAQAPAAAGPHPAAGIERVEASGAFIGPASVVNGFMIGYSRRQSVFVDPRSDLLIDATTLADGHFIVTVQPVYVIGEPAPGAPPLPAALASVSAPPSPAREPPRSQEHHP